MRPARTSRNFSKGINFGPFLRFEMRTTDNIKDEIFGSLEYITEIEEVSHEFLLRRGQTRNFRHTFLQMQAFVRQAKTFYESAETLHYRASPLNYYYSFLNLVKAYLSITNPKAVGGKGKVYHGLTIPKRSGTSLQQAVQTNNGVFPMFYRQVTGDTVRRKTRFKFFDLLGYCSDIALEYRIGGFGDDRITWCRIAIATDHESGETYVLLGVLDFEKIEYYKKTLSPFNKYFEEVDLTKDSCREIFNVYAEEMRRYKFFESCRTLPVGEDGRFPLGRLAMDAFEALRPIFEQVNYSDEGDFRLVAPLRKNLQIPMRECVAIYASMFYLGSLVRYDPAYLEHMLESREAWIIERFTKTAPITFLRQIRNLIDGRNFIYVSR